MLYYILYSQVHVPVALKRYQNGNTYHQQKMPAASYVVPDTTYPRSFIEIYTLTNQKAFDALTPVPFMARRAADILILYRNWHDCILKAISIMTT